MSMPGRRAARAGIRRRWLGLVAGLGLVGVLLVLPAPLRHSATASAGPAATPSGPVALTLKAAWPGAAVFSLPATLADGSTYLPQTVVDATTSIGVATSGDALRSSLVVVGPAERPRVLDSGLVNDGASFDAVTLTAEAIYWMHTVNDADGHARVSLWTAGRSGGPSRQLSPDGGAALFSGSAYDMQVVGGRLYWLAGTATTANTELRSIALSGGRVTVRALPGAWTMAAWPWLVTAPSATGTPVELSNVDTGARVAVHAPTNKMVTCSPTWCRLIADNATQASTTDLVHPDGTDLQRIGEQNAIAIASDVALRQRFEPLMTALTSTNSTTVSRLDLYDIARRRTVLIEPAATNAAAKGDYLWWSTGDNETLAWHALDLRSLT
jgi:hypothetical protein